MTTKTKINVRTPQDGLLANIPGRLIYSSTFDNASLPATAIVVSVKAYSESNSTLDAGLNVSLGYAGNVSAYFNSDVSTDDLNSNTVVSKLMTGLQYGLDASKALYAQTDIDLTGNPIGFEIVYVVRDATSFSA